MTIKAYILINVVSSNLAETLNNIRKVDGVKFADAVTGPYDAIVQIEANDVNQIGRIITLGLLKIPGVAKTLTCVVV